MKFIKYTGRYKVVTCLDIEFPRDEWVPVPPRLADKILGNKEFVLKDVKSDGDALIVLHNAPLGAATPSDEPLEEEAPAEDAFDALDGLVSDEDEDFYFKE